MADRWVPSRRSAVVVVLLGLAALLLVAGRPSMTPGAAADDPLREVAPPVSPRPSTTPHSTPQVLGGRLLSGRPLDATGAPVVRRGRVVLTPVHPDENPDSLSPPVTSPAFVTNTVLDAQVRLADSALPWSYWIAPGVAERWDAAVIREAVAAWDDLPGSRWATAYAGPGEVQLAEPVADGRSTIFAESACEDLITANTYLFTDGGLGIDRYGTRTTQILEADIGICPGVDSASALRRAVVHEVGHVMGLAHLCDAQDNCWQDGMGPGPHSCRIMFWQARACQSELSAEDVVAAARQYPAVRPLEGPTTEEALARVSFASTPEEQAPVVVVVQASTPLPALAAAARQAAAADGPLLQVQPDPSTCLSGSGATEANRTLVRRGELILIGEWPSSCRRLAYDWDVQLRVVPVDVAESSLNPDSQELVVTRTGESGPVPHVGPAVALAADRGAALLVLGPDGPSAAQSTWLVGREDALDRVFVVGAAPEDLGVPPLADLPAELVGSPTGSTDAVTVLRDLATPDQASVGTIGSEPGPPVLALAAAVMAVRQGLALQPVGSADPPTAAAPAGGDGPPSWQVGLF